MLDQSRSAASTELLARLDGAGVFTRAATLTSSDQIASQIDAGKALMVISIPADFQDRLAAGQRAPLQVILDGRIRRRRRRRLPGVHRGRLQRAAWRPGPGVAVERRAWYNPTWNRAGP